MARARVRLGLIVLFAGTKAWLPFCPRGKWRGKMGDAHTAKPHRPGSYAAFADDILLGP